MSLSYDVRRRSRGWNDSHGLCLMSRSDYVVATDMNRPRPGENGKTPVRPVLKLDPPIGWGQPIAVHVDVRDENLYDLVLSVLSQVGARRVTGPPTHILTDEINDAHKRHDATTRVFVISGTMRMPQDYFSAVTSGRAHGIISVERIARLPAVLAAAASGFSCVPSSLIEEVMQAPMLTVRQQQVLEAVSRGLTNETIARRCGVSVSTIKREITQLLITFDVTSRAELAAKAIELSLVPMPLS
jgi:DNA-binding NarL/FixJ family response regulator